MQQIKFIQELLPLMTTLLLQRVLFLSNNRILSESSAADVQSYNLLFPIIAIGTLIELANIASINNGFSREGTVPRSALWSAMSKNLVWIFVLAGAGLLLKEQAFRFLKLDAGPVPIAPQDYVLALAALSAITIFSVLEGFLILQKLTSRLPVILLGFAVANAGLCRALIAWAHMAPLRAVLLSTAASYLLSALAAAFLLLRAMKPGALAAGEDRAFLWIWISELKIAIVRTIAPLVFVYFLLRAEKGADLLASYNMSLQLAYLCALPFLAGAPIAIREQGKWQKAAAGRQARLSPFLLRSFLPCSILPTALAFALMTLSPGKALQATFAYRSSPEAVVLLQLFFLASVFGQAGHFFAVPVRASGKVYLVTLSFLIAELGVQPLLLSRFQQAGALIPRNIGLAIVGFTVSYLLLNLSFYVYLRNRSAAC
jgi:hypothetical protein